MATSTRERLHEATLACAARSALGFTVDDVATEAGVSRATVYRHFPGGREQLIHDGVQWEVTRFFTRLSALVAEGATPRERMERAVLHGRRLLTSHEVMNRLLLEDRAEFVAELEANADDVLDGLVLAVRTLLAEEVLADGLGLDVVADHLARLYLSYLGHSGSWDLDDPAEVARLVDQQFVVVLAPD